MIYESRNSSTKSSINRKFFQAVLVIIAFLCPQICLAKGSVLGFALLDNLLRNKIFVIFFVCFPNARACVHTDSLTISPTYSHT